MSKPAETLIIIDRRSRRTRILIKTGIIALFVAAVLAPDPFSFIHLSHPFCSALSLC